MNGAANPSFLFHWPEIEVAIESRGMPRLGASTMRRCSVFIGSICLAMVCVSAAWAFPPFRVPRFPVFPIRNIGNPPRLPNINGGLKLTTAHVDFELETDGDTLIRTEVLAEQYDDKGKLKKFTKEELKELKGDPKLPGYKAEYSDVKQGEIVKVVFAKPKEADKKDDKKKDDKKGDKDKKNTPAELNVHELIGKVTRVEGTTKKFVLRVDYTTLGGRNYVNGKDNEVPLDKKVAMIVIGTPGDAKGKK